MSAPPLLVADGATRTVFEFARIQSPVDWVLPLVVFLGLCAFVVWTYLRDARELRPAVAGLLVLLRVAALLGLLVLYLQPQWRTEREVVHPSRVLVLADVSSSMGLSDPGTPAGQSAISRGQQVASALEQTDFLTQLRRTHDVVVLKFAENVERVVSLSKVGQGRASGDHPSPVGSPANPAANAPDPAAPALDSDPSSARIDWAKTLAPTGRETRLGQALRQALAEEHGAPVAGLVVFTDGGHNAGPSPEAAVQLAREARVPIFPVGVGSPQRPANVCIDKLEALPRAYPGDPMAITALVQAQQLAGQTVTVELVTRPSGGASQPGTGTVAASEQVILGADGDILPVKFQWTPEQTGRITLCVRVHPPASDQNPADDLRETDVEVVDRKDRVLLFAGGPTREYQFVRTLLFRDPTMTVDIVLQTGQSGISQEADAILDDFPATREEMFAYDCVVAFDPDWKALSPGQVELLESWVAEQAGGLIVIAGPIYTGEAVHGWTQDPAMAKLRALYPVEFARHVSVLESSTYYASSEPWPLDFTREGLEAEFLWLADTAPESRQLWSEFAGVYACQPVRGPKPGAVVLARFSDPNLGQGERQPVYMAEQFYGSGRVLYLGSGEMWRLRRVATDAFDRLYTRLVRHVSQGRLVRQSSRGVLMVGQDECTLGHTVQVRAQLTNAQLAPLDVPTVNLEVFLPDGGVQAVPLKPDPSRLGTYAGQFIVLAEGVYRLELPVPDSGERLTRRVQVRLPDLEREHPERNDPLLTRIATGSGGKYYPDVQAALGPSANQPVVGLLKDRTRTSIQPVAPDVHWERTWMGWLMGLICGVLCVEWLIRRLSRLA